MGYKADCLWFTGYKPCKFKRSCDNCPNYEKPASRIAVVSLEAMGAVLRSTCLLPAIKRKYPNSHITWITYSQSRPLLDQNELIDRMICVSDKTASLINHLKFDVLFGVDKSLEAGSLVEQIKSDEKYGFGLDHNGSIRPLTKAADYQFAVGLDDQLKFFDNEKPETQQLTESMELVWERDPYVFQFSKEEQSEVNRRKDKLKGSSKGVIGYNTGCSLLYPNKKLTVKKSIELIKSWRTAFPEHKIALLVGPEDSQRHEEIFAVFENDPMVVDTPTKGGLRSGIMWVDCCDLVFSGCSLGMHIAISLKKKVIAWYGVSCSQEVDLYDRGYKIQSKVSCSPCWKKTCGNDPMCYDRVELAEVIEATEKLMTD